MLPIKAPYNESSIITFGGTIGIPPGAPLATNLSTITTVTRAGDVNNRLTKGQLNNRRWFHDGTILPDGTILAANGGDKDSLQMPGYEFAVRQAEIYDPATDRWKAVASAARDRHYHETATLLPDGRVLSGGMSSVATMYGHRRDQAYGFFANNEKDSSFEIYSPPYLFRGDRPEIGFAPSGVAWGSNFDVNMKGSDEIDSIALIRTGSPQHGLDTDIRSVELEFTQDGQQAVGGCAARRHDRPARLLQAVRQQEVRRRASSRRWPPSSGSATSSAAQALATPAAIPMQDSSAAASNGSATPDEDSSKNDFGECTGCAKGERGGMRQRPAAVEPGAAAAADLGRGRRRHPVDGVVPPVGTASWAARREPRPMLVG